MKTGKMSETQKWILNCLAEQPAVEIRGHQECHCGSGRPFSDCCQRRGHVYRLAWKTKEGSKAVIDATLLAERALDLVTYVEKKRIRRPANQQIFAYISGFYARYDRLVEVFSHLVSCRRRCHYCCMYFAGMSCVEARYINNYVSKNLTSEVIREIERTIKKQAHNYIPSSRRPSNPRKDQKMMASYFAKRLRCPFLSPSDDCLIYPARPFTCRSHSAVTPAETCATGKGLELLDVMNLNDWLAEHLVDISRAWYGNGDWEQIGLWFLDGF